MSTHVLPSLLLMGASLIGSLSACDRGTQRSADTGPVPSPTPAAPMAGVDPALAAEFAQLPSGVIIRAPLDAKGQPVAAQAELRTSDAKIASAADTTAAFTKGHGSAGAAALTSQDNLVSGGYNPLPTPAWGDYRRGWQNGGHATYQPTYNSLAKPGYAYNYKLNLQYVVGSFLYYVYQKPGCILALCTAGGHGGPAAYPGGNVPPTPPAVPSADDDAILADAFKEYGVHPVSDGEYPAANQAKIELGARLFHDPILSARGDISCSTCHVESRATADALSLSPTGEVLAGLKHGPMATSDLLGRSTPPLFNLGHASFKTMFWDSRVAASPSIPSGYQTPAGADLPLGLENALAAQALFPMINPKEMSVGILDANGKLQQSKPSTVLWQEISARVLARPEYQSMLALAYPEAKGGHFGIEHLGNAIAAFESWKWRSDQSPFDAYLRGDLQALNPQQKRGAVYFYTKGNCASCHSGPFQTDHLHHATAVPQFGPGNGDGSHGWEDFGLGHVSGNPADNYKFRTPALRNVAMTGPWGHNGAYNNLKSFVEHYIDPAAALDHWSPKQTTLSPISIVPLDQVIAPWLDLPARSALKAANEAKPVPLAPEDIDAIVAFLCALTDPHAGSSASGLGALQPQAL